MQDKNRFLERNFINFIILVNSSPSKTINRYPPDGGREGGCDCGLVRAEQSLFLDPQRSKLILIIY